MKILYVIDSLVPSGAELSLAAMAPLLVERGVDLGVAYLKDDPGLQDEIRDAGARLFPLAGSGGRLGRIIRCRRLIVSEHPDLVHTTLFEADLAGRIAARLAGVPVVTTLAGTHYGPEQFNSGQVPRWKLRSAQATDIATARLARRFHAVSREVADTMSQRLRIPTSRIDVIPRGRDPQTLGTRDEDRRARARRGLGISPSTPLVLAAARHEYAKGLDVLLNSVPGVLAEDPNVRFVIAGREGSQTERLRAIVAEHDVASAVDFLGARDDVFELMCAADVFVAPSRREGSPGAVLEAMALEVPIAATSLPAIRELLGADTAGLVPAENSERLAVAIVQTLQDPVASKARAATARQRFLESFTLDRIVDEMLAFYRAALHED